MRLLPLLLTCWTVTTVTTVNAATPLTDLKLGLFDWVSYFDTPNEPYDKNFSQAITVNFMLAAKHFNERRSDLLPVLNSPLMQTCPQLNISVQRMCDTSGQSRRIMKDVESFPSEFHALVGFASSAELLASAQMAEVTADLPIFNHWCSSPLLQDRKLFPKLLRTGQDDGIYAISIAKLVKRFGYTRVALMHIVGDSGPAFNDVLRDELSSQGVTLVSFGFIDSHPASINSTMRQIKESLLNVIIFYGYASDYVTGSVPELAASNQLSGGEKLWIFTNFDRPPTQEDLEADPNVKALFSNSLRVTNTIPAQRVSAFNAYVAQWESNAVHVPWMNAKFPPHGSIAQSCKFESLDYQLPGNFFEFSQDFRFEVWAFAYDTVIAAGLAACSLASNVNLINGSSLYQAAVNLEFNGMSGFVKFDPTTGVRSPDAFTTILQNWKPSRTVDYFDQNAGTYVVNGSYSDGVWVFPSNTQLEFNTGVGLGNLPPQITPPPVDYQYIPSALRYVAIVEVAVILFLCLASAAFIFAVRTTRVGAQSQPVFMYLIFLGIAISGIAILPLSVDDYPGSVVRSNPSAACNSAPSLVAVGLMLALAALGAKTYRLRSVFTSKSLHVGVTVRRLMMYIGVVMACEVLVVLCFVLAAPLHWTRVSTSVDAMGFTVQSLGYCLPMSGSIVVLAVLLVMHVLVLLWVLYLNNDLKAIPEEFQEAKYMTLALTIWLQLVAVGLPVLAAVNESPIGRFVILTSFILCSDLVLLGFLMIPKLMRHREGQLQAKKRVMPIMLDLNVLEGLKVHRIRERFEKYSVTHFVIESYHFLSDIEQWKASYKRMSSAAVFEEALALCKMYVQQGSLLQVNISSKVRSQIEVALSVAMLSSHDGSKRVPWDVFDEAMNEVSQMLNHGAWADFVEQGGLYGLKAEDLKVYDAIVQSQASGGSGTRQQGQGSQSGGLPTKTPGSGKPTDMTASVVQLRLSEEDAMKVRHNVTREQV